MENLVGKKVKFKVCVRVCPPHRSIPDDITEANSQVVARHPVHPNPLVPAGVIRQDDAHGLPSLPSSQHHGVPAEELQLLRLILT